jgi:hypothetical protein
MLKHPRVLNDSEIDAVSGGMISLANIPGYNTPHLNKSGTVGQGDTIDAVGKDWQKDPSWGNWNNNLPGQGPWGN